MRFKELDLMRFFAALSVVFYHYTAGFSAEHFLTISDVSRFGYLGVPFFFMISGFVIFASAHNRTPVAFAISRVTRVYPTLFVCSTFTVLIVYLFGRAETEISLIQYLANLTLLNTYAGIDYLDGVYWTLLAELKFYFCIFALLALGYFDKYKVWLSIWMVLTILFLAFRQPFFMGMFISPEYSAFFIAGIVFYLIRRDGITHFYALLLSVSLGVASIMAYEQVGQFITAPTETTRWLAVSLIWLFYAIFFLLALDKINLKSYSILLTLGGMTYPLYLIHSRAGRVIFDHYIEDFDPYLLLVVITSFMLLVAYLVHMYVEKVLANSLKKYLIKCFASGNGLEENKKKPSLVVSDK